MTPSLAATIAARFPLVARKRPPAKPLDVRVDRLVRLAETAQRESDPDKASMVFNGAALIASDCGDPHLARAWCHRHASLYLNQAPLTGHTARFALEPVVNLARLRIREGDGDGAYRLLTHLYTAIVGGTPAVLDDLEVHPRQLPADPEELDQIIGWLRGTLLSDGTRALVLAERWDDAVNHVRRYDGVGPTLMDGRQVAIVAHLLQDEGPAAAALLTTTKTEAPWEDAVHGLLTTWLELAAGHTPVDHADLIDRVSTTPRTTGLTVFRVRLGLTALDLAVSVPTAAVDSLTKQLVADAIHDEDANAARDLINHPAITSESEGTLRALMEASGLGQGHLPAAAVDQLSSTLDVAGTAIQRHLPCQQNRFRARQPRSMLR
ncbi:hypothetical protein [Micromonospora sp. RL09-050-HVF-A]|uniref:hypothetical protein n=1 Tax=Micromonospora sp. RL09-050-HVF-A TaxID=1703433 RepID=UPI001C5E2768|nr:hypothetical protein [Micromonospora sp. RL09-050-HVF-A]MBW4705151.1 hypothetical protein [Micromonospora sp. RL09-050-HVF-A]